MVVFGKTKRGQFYPKRGADLDVVISDEILPFRGTGVTVLPGKGDCPVYGCPRRGVHIHAAAGSDELEDTKMHERVHVLQLQQRGRMDFVKDTRGIEPGTYEYFSRYRHNPAEQEAEVFAPYLAAERRRLLGRVEN